MKNNIIYKAFKELFCASKKMFLISYLLTCLQGLSRILPIIAIQQLFDHLYLLEKEGGIKELSVYILAFMGARCVCHIIDLLTNYLYESYNLTAGFGMERNVNTKIDSASAIQFEKPEFLDSITKAYRGTKSIRRFIDTWMLIIFLYVPELAVIIFYLYSASPFLPLILLFVIVPSIIVLKLQEKESAVREEKISVIQRKKEVLENQTFDLKSNMESRVLGYLPLLTGKIIKCITDTAVLDGEYQSKKSKLDNIEKITILFGHICIFASLLYCTVFGYVSVGVFSALVTTLDELFELMEVILSTIAEGVSEELEKIRNYFRLTGLSEGQEKSEKQEKHIINHIKKIEFKNVSFSYPERSEKAINNVSFVLNEGDNAAIVGKNGSGKSTLLKLLSGMYECDEGTILVNDMDIKNIEKKSLYKLFSAVFQNYGRYALNVNDNICLNGVKNEGLLAKIKNLKGLDEISKIDNGEILSREFGGRDLSGGQWQRIAIARCEYRDSEVYLLDEPTSAIDPNEEKAIYDLFDELMKNRTSLIVTHRMSATRLAGKIMVLKEGKMAGYGNHSELMETCKEYQQLWNSQAQIYRE